MIYIRTCFSKRSILSTVEKYQVIHFILLGSCEERIMANVLVYEGWLRRRTEDITQEFFWNKLQNGNLENVTSSLQRINNAFEITIAPI